MGEKRNACRLLVGNPEGKRPLGRPRRGWVDNITMDLVEVEWDGVDGIDLGPIEVMSASPHLKRQGGPVI
jgi:hypothetical protein